MYKQRKKNEDYNFQQAFCVSLAYCIALILYYYFDSPKAYWIPMTVGLMFVVPIRGIIVQRSLDRIFGTSIGLLLCFFFVEIFLFSDYRWAYLTPFMFFLMVYIIMITQNYGISVVLISMFVPLASIILSQHVSFDVSLILIKRFIFTFSGVIIAISCEFTIYKSASGHNRKVKKNTRNYFNTFGEILSLCNEAFAKNINYDEKIKEKVNCLLGQVTLIEKFHVFAKHEYGSDKYKMMRLNFVSRKISQINQVFNSMMSILNNDCLDESLLSREEFKIFSQSITVKYKKYVDLLYSEKEIPESAIDKILLKHSCNPTGLYIEHLLELDLILNRTITGIRNNCYLE